MIVTGGPAGEPGGRFTSVAVLSRTGEVVCGAPILECDAGKMPAGRSIVRAGRGGRERRIADGAGPANRPPA